jgi:hypothetical protein
LDQRPGSSAARSRLASSASRPAKSKAHQEIFDALLEAVQTFDELIHCDASASPAGVVGRLSGQHYTLGAGAPAVKACSAGLGIAG